VSFSNPEYSQMAIPRPATNAESGPLSGATNGTRGLSLHRRIPSKVIARNGKKIRIVRITDAVPTGRMPRQFM